MTRRGSQIPWNTRSGGGLYGGSPQRPYARIAVLALIVLAALALAYFLFTKACGGTGCDKFYCESGSQFAPPEGYELVTKVYQYNKNKGNVASGNNLDVRLPVTKATTDSRNLSFYQYIPETKAWEPVAPALLDPQGKEVSATLSSAPQYMAVLRRNSPGGMVVAYLPHGAALHHDAVGKVTMIHTLDFTPAADGTVAGELSNLKPDNTFQWIPTISATGAGKGQVATVQAILSTPANRSAHVENIVKKVADTGVAGIDIAYLDLTVNERTSFALFIGELGQRLHAQGKQLTVTLQPPIRNQDRIEEGAYDWAEIGKAADVIQLAPYRDQGKFRTDMPAILGYLTTRVQPTTRLVLTVTPYASEKSVSGITTMSVTQAMTIATQIAVRADKIQASSQVTVVGTNIDKEEGRTGVQWFPDSACVAFTYEQNGGRTVWIENFFSVGFKLEYINQYKLGGVAVEDASEDTYLGNIWTAVLPFVSSGQPILLAPNANDLAPKWTVSKGTFEDNRKGRITWSTPAEPGTYTITLTLSDGVSLYQSEATANIVARDTKTPVAGTATATN